MCYVFRLFFCFRQIEFICFDIASSNYAKTKTQISCAVAVQLISAFVFAT